MVNRLLILFMALAPISAFADWLEFTEISVDYHRFFEGSRHPLVTGNGLPNKTLGEALGLNLNLDVFKYGYWNNTIHSLTDRDLVIGGGQYRTVGLQLQLGIHLTSFLDIEFKHHSQHILDTVYPYDRYPVEDGIGIKIFFYSLEKRKSLIGDIFK